MSEVVRAQTNACALMLDLAEIDLIDARGLGVLVELRQWTQSRGIEFRLMNVTRLVQQVLAMTRLDTVLQMSSPEKVERAATASLRANFRMPKPGPCAEVLLD